MDFTWWSRGLPNFPPAGGIGVRGFPLQAVQNVHLRDACALAAPGGEGLAPPAAGLFPGGKLIGMGGRSPPPPQKGYHFAPLPPAADCARWV